MKHLLMSALLAFGAVAPQAFASRVEATDIAQSLREDLTQLAGSARSVAQNATANGNEVRAQRFRALAAESTDLAQDVRQYIIRPLQQGASQAEVRNNARYVNERDLNAAINNINQAPQDIDRLIRNVRTGLNQLRRAIDQNWGGGGGGGNGTWVADCRIVLETIWGTDLQDFYGRGRAQNQQVAVQEAREDGLNQCNSQRGGALQRCVVDSNNCRASRRN